MRKRGRRSSPQAGQGTQGGGGSRPHPDGISGPTLCRRHLLDASATADMLAWANSGFSIDASVRIALIDRDVPSYFQSLEHLLRSCARPPFAIKRLSVTRDASGRIARVRYVLPRHKAANWVAGVVGGSRLGRGPMASSNSRRLSSSTGSPISSRRRGSTGIATTGAAATRLTRPKSPARTTRHGLPGPS